jgi:methyltransferase (TIGR00027 family)
LNAAVSDTARWVAVYRAWEYAQAKPLFCDPYADRFAGARGRDMAALIPHDGWPLIVRTKLIDDLVLQAIAQGCDCVVNLGAGFDMRPYRLALPESLLWIEVDLPDLMQEKERMLGGAKPHFELHRIMVDLTAADALMNLEALSSAAQRVLVITEGLLIYWQESQVRALARELCDRPIHWWVLDLASPAMLEQNRQTLHAVTAKSPMRFAPTEGVGYFEALGWSATEVHSVLHAAHRLARLPADLLEFARQPEPDPRNLGSSLWSAVVQLEPK